MQTKLTRLLALCCAAGLFAPGIVRAQSANDGFEPNPDGPVRVIAVDAQGRVIIGGAFTTVDGVNRRNLARLHGDGTVDEAFNVPANDGVSAVAVQADGKILVGGEFSTLGGQPRSSLARLHADGGLDPTFDPGANDEVYCLLLQADGKILVGGGFTTLGGQLRSRLGRLNANGSLDTGFNPAANEHVIGLAVQTDGKILVGGRFTNLGGQPREHVGRLNLDGSLEIRFNPGANNWVSSFALQTGGKILVGGFFTTLGGEPRSHLGRLNADGSVYACTAALAGLVSWWKAENNAGDTLGNHNGFLQGGLRFGPGQVGQAFNFTAAGQAVQVGASSSINVGTGGGYTTEGWINPLNVTSQNPIFEWNDGVTAGAHLWIAASVAGFGGPGSLYASLIAGTTDTTVATGPGVVSAGVWQHVAFTYDRASGMGRLYLNGTEVASRAVGDITAQTALPLYIGRRPNFGAETFTGKIDELSLYNRALSSVELQAIYNAGSAGKCAPLPNLSSGTVAWGDYDNDGRLDLLLTGSSVAGAFVSISELWHNDGNGVFTQVPVPGLPGVDGSSVAWGDYDNDGRLDFLLTGSGVSQLWHNDGNGTFTQVPVPGLPRVYGSSVSWGDYDNDGRLDFLLTGSIPNEIEPVPVPVSQLWHNDGNGSFTQLPVSGLPGVHNSSVAWGDYDNDGWLDFLLTGDSLTNIVSQLWHNNGDGRFTQLPVPGLPGVDSSSVSWGDYDNDGWLDFLLIGHGKPSSVYVSQLWHNSNGTFSNVTSVSTPGLPGVYGGSVSWGDYDNDGRLDFLLTGDTGTGGVSQLWHNNGNGTFSNTTSVAAPGLPGVENSSVAWGDYDNDGQLDFLLTGYDGTKAVTRLWHNQVVTTNNSPGPPGGLSMVMTNDDVMLNWSAASDAETPAAGLTYNLRMGTTPGGSDLVSPHAAANGFQRLPAMGNRQQMRSFKFPIVPLNKPLYWSVQAVDTAFAGSAFAPEKSFKVFAFIAPVTASAVVPGDLNGDGVVDQSELNAVLTNYWPSSPWLQMNDPAKLPDGLFQFALTNASAWRFSVEVTTNFITWGPLGPAYPVYQFHDPASTNSPMRYYRLRWP